MTVMGFWDNLVNHRMSRDGVQARKSGNQYEVSTGGFVPRYIIFGTVE